VVGEEPFLGERMRQDAIIRKLEVIGERSNSSRGDAPATTEIPWKQIAGIRDRLTTGHFGVDLRLVWRVVERDVPSLSAAVEALLTGTGASGPSGRVDDRHVRRCA
jgi:uncharacterized protein with HEPN domain